MMLQIFAVILLILIVIIIFLFMKPLHIYAVFNSNNLEYEGIINIKHLLFFSYDIKERTLSIGIKYKSKEFIPISIVLTTDSTVKTNKNHKENHKDNKVTAKLRKIKNSLISYVKKDDSEDLEDDVEFEENSKDKYDELYSALENSSSDLYEIILLLVKTCKFNESHAIINFGLGDNNLTIKICNVIWAVTAPLYPLYIQVLLIPEINKQILKTDIDISLNIILFNILKIILKVLFNRNILSIISIVRKW